MPSSRVPWCRRFASVVPRWIMNFARGALVPARAKQSHCGPRPAIRLHIFIDTFARTLLVARRSLLPTFVQMFAEVRTSISIDDGAVIRAFEIVINADERINDGRINDR
jgi:hypothetical protein